MTFPIQLMSENEQKLRNVFCEVLQLPAEEIHAGVAYDKTKTWDSVAHMALVAAIDSAFDIMMDTDDVIDMNSYGKAKKILGKYGVHF
jgi:acyl carrier protein